MNISFVFTEGNGVEPKGCYNHSFHWSLVMLLLVIYTEFIVSQLFLQII